MPDPKASSPFGLKPGLPPKVHVEAGHVVVSFELVSLRDPSEQQVLDIALPANLAASVGWALVDHATKLGQAT